MKKIRFVKEYRAIKLNKQNASSQTFTYREGDVLDEVLNEEAQWIIDNGFAEEVEEPDWWTPEYGERYYYLDGAGCISTDDWEYTGFDAWRRDIGNVFKTHDAAERYRDYLEAVEAVRHDEGFMKISRKVDYSPYGYGIFRCYLNGDIIAEEIDDAVKAGEFYFDTEKHAKASVEAHQPEWRTILNYDWSKE